VKRHTLSLHFRCEFARDEFVTQIQSFTKRVRRIPGRLTPLPARSCLTWSRQLIWLSIHPDVTACDAAAKAMTSKRSNVARRFLHSLWTCATDSELSVARAALGRSNSDSTP
jgi:hypothetical protein